MRSGNVLGGREGGAILCLIHAKGTFSLLMIFVFCRGNDLCGAPDYKTVDDDHEQPTPPPPQMTAAQKKVKPAYESPPKKVPVLARGLGRRRIRWFF
jgi:hypothetical protein